MPVCEVTTGPYIVKEEGYLWWGTGFGMGCVQKSQCGGVKVWKLRRKSFLGEKVHSAMS